MGYGKVAPAAFKRMGLGLAARVIAKTNRIDTKSHGFFMVCGFSLRSAFFVRIVTLALHPREFEVNWVIFILKKIRSRRHGPGGCPGRASLVGAGRRLRFLAQNAVAPELEMPDPDAANAENVLPAFVRLQNECRRLGTCGQSRMSET
jgi:hypothetical protein